MEISSSLITKTVIISFSKLLVFWPFEDFKDNFFIHLILIYSLNGQNTSNLQKEIITVLVINDDVISKILLQI